MRLLIFILALLCAFFVSANAPEGFPSDRYEWPGVPSESTIYYECYTSVNGSHSTIVERTSQCIEWAYNIRISQPDMAPFCRVERTTVKQQTDTYFRQTLEKYASNSNGCVVHRGYDSFNVQWTELPPDPPTCPPEAYPLHNFPWPQIGPIETCHKAIDVDPEPEPDLDPDCPAPTDNDPWVFGTGQQQTVCFDNPDGSQCSIETDSNGGYSMPVSYGSQEPVACTDIDPTDPDPSDPDPTDPDPTDPDPTDPDPTDPDPTDPDPTDPDPSDPDPTDDTDQTEIIDALNQSNDNLDAINNNLVDGLGESNNLLSDLMDGIEGLISGQDDANGHLQDISDNTEGILDALNDDGGEQPDCIGDLCNQDIEAELSDLDQEFQDWMEEDVQIAPEVTTLTGKFKSFVSQNFAGFTGSCQPFSLDVSVAGDSKTITVSQHCEPYETYFKPLVEWLIWTFTAIALLNISSQSFRAFSSI